MNNDGVCRAVPGFGRIWYQRGYLPSFKTSLNLSVVCNIKKFIKNVTLPNAIPIAFLLEPLHPGIFTGHSCLWLSWVKWPSHIKSGNCRTAYNFMSRCRCFLLVNYLLQLLQFLWLWSGHWVSKYMACTLWSHLFISLFKVSQKRTQKLYIYN